MAETKKYKDPIGIQCVPTCSVRVAVPRTAGALRAERDGHGAGGGTVALCCGLSAVPAARWRRGGSLPSLGRKAALFSRPPVLLCRRWPPCLRLNECAAARVRPARMRGSNAAESATEREKGEERSTLRFRFWREKGRPLAQQFPHCRRVVSVWVRFTRSAPHAPPYPDKHLSLSFSLLS